ncbi:uncharacterized protein F5891DRAFT_1199341 [Suillus fuscotomentosus]|uniref:Uncharacterized protein n=1 Tax=Suillus fuscotomentosus TaxID=1912939 RepID=A0AAD4HCX0_9AGAM|nr:uncharacterized protein F5891DRAFT_1199341 [Suillus fuscotomentosus]KAG1888021.1 hypothetical protein F5891DRAFT_1199341 [Suillus fuscotomentosus]
MQLMPGQMADEWFQSLDSAHTATFVALKIAFFKQWPLPKLPKLSHAQQREHVAAQALKEGDIGVLTPDGNIAHVVWATEVSQLALGMGDLKGDFIEDALKGITNLLKDHLTGTYSTWDEFIEDVRWVPNIKLQCSREKLENAWSSSILLPSYSSPSPITSTNIHASRPLGQTICAIQLLRPIPHATFQPFALPVATHGPVFSTGIVVCGPQFNSLTQYLQYSHITHIQDTILHSLTIRHIIFLIILHHIVLLAAVKILSVLFGRLILVTFGLRPHIHRLWYNRGWLHLERGEVYQGGGLAQVLALSHIHLSLCNRGWLHLEGWHMEWGALAGQDRSGRCPSS